MTSQLAIPGNEKTIILVFPATFCCNLVMIRYPGDKEFQKTLPERRNPTSVFFFWRCSGLPRGFSNALKGQIQVVVAMNISNWLWYSVYKYKLAQINKKVVESCTVNISVSSVYTIIIYNIYMYIERVFDIDFDLHIHVRYIHVLYMYSTNLSRKPGCFHPHLMCPEALTAFRCRFFWPKNQSSWAERNG